jgi:hypothetical protein
MLRGGLVTLLLGCGAALLITALHLVPGTPGSLIAHWWPLVLVGAGVAGLPRGLGPQLFGRWVPLGVLVAGLVLLALRLASLPVRELLLAALLVWLGLAVATGGRTRGSGRSG